MKLHFATAVVQSLIDHGVTSSQRMPALEQRFQDRFQKEGTDLPIDGKGALPSIDDIDMTKVPPGLWLVCDGGIYLMSNGRPGLRTKGEALRNIVACTKECEPDANFAWWEVRQAIFDSSGGGLFLESHFVDMMLMYATEAYASLDLTRDAVVVSEPYRRAKTDPTGVRASRKTSG